MWKNLASLSLATARASRVLPVPGGPCSKTPLGGSTPSRWNSSGWRSGSSTISRNAPLAVALGEFGQELDLGVGVDVDNSLGGGADDRQPNLLKRERGRVQHRPD